MEEIHEGALCFSKTILSIFSNDEINISQQLITSWLNCFIANPTKEDKDFFGKTLCAYDPEHRDYKVIFPQWYKNNSNYNTQYIADNVQKVYIMGINLITIKKRKTTTRYKLFGFIPLIKVKYFT